MVKNTSKIRTLVLPSLLGSAIWKQVAKPSEYDQIIFGGGISTRECPQVTTEEDNYRTTCEVAEFLDKYPHQTTAIISGIDSVYLGFENNTYFISHKILNKMREVLKLTYDKGYLDVATRIKNYLFTYGPVSYDWYHQVFLPAYEKQYVKEDSDIAQQLVIGYNDPVIKKLFYAHDNYVRNNNFKVIKGPFDCQLHNLDDTGLLTFFKNVVGLGANAPYSFCRTSTETMNDNMTEVILYNHTYSIYTPSSIPDKTLKPLILDI